ncbi:hypothetical protein WJX77_011292 [Trebouxia sp. C0004]
MEQRAAVTNRRKEARWLIVQEARMKYRLAYKGVYEASDRANFDTAFPTFSCANSFVFAWLKHTAHLNGQQPDAVAREQGVVERPGSILCPDSAA